MAVDCLVIAYVPVLSVLLVFRAISGLTNATASTLAASLADITPAADRTRRFGYAGPKLRGAVQRFGKFTMEIIKRTDKAKGFEVPWRRWVIERTFAWLIRCRRLAKDFERTMESAQA